MTDKTPQNNTGATTPTTKPLSLQRTLESLAYHLRTVKKHDVGMIVATIPFLCDEPTSESVSKQLKFLTLVIDRDEKIEKRSKAMVVNLCDVRANLKHIRGAA